MERVGGGGVIADTRERINTNLDDREINGVYALFAVSTRCPSASTEGKAFVIFCNYIMEFNGRVNKREPGPRFVLIIQASN